MQNIERQKYVKEKRKTNLAKGRTNIDEFNIE